MGYLRDIRRLTVALSRARLGFYILGRREVFENCYELRDAFRVLLQRPDKLLLTIGELFPAQRLLNDEVDATEMTGVEHLGQYVYDMTQAKLEAVRAGENVVLIRGTDAIRTDVVVTDAADIASDAEADEAIPDVEPGAEEEDEEDEEDSEDEVD